MEQQRASWAAAASQAQEYNQQLATKVSDLETQLAELRSGNTDLTANVDRLTAALHDTKAGADHLEQQRASWAVAASQAQDYNQQLTSKVSDLEAQLAELRSGNTDLTANVDRLTAALHDTKAGAEWLERQRLAWEQTAEDLRKQNALLSTDSSKQ